MATFNDIPVLSKVKIGGETYYLKDAEARVLLGELETALGAEVDRAKEAYQQK